MRARALRLLARREHSRHELRCKLEAESEDANYLDQLLDEFERRGWISEQRLVEQVLHVRGRRYGSTRLLHELEEKKISSEVLQQARTQLRDTELQRAHEIWRKRFGQLPHSRSERAKQARFLQARGFALEVIMQVWRLEESVATPAAHIDKLETK